MCAAVAVVIMVGRRGGRADSLLSVSASEAKKEKDLILNGGEWIHCYFGSVECTHCDLWMTQKNVAHLADHNLFV